MIAERKPPITILMAVYNGEDWIEESINSVLNQSFSDFEFIIVDDGSKDRSREIIEEIAGDDPRIRFFRKMNTGLADSLNFGLKRANGAWVARLDADDICRADRLAKQYKAATSRENVVLVGSGLQIIDELGHVGREYRYTTQHKSIVLRLSQGSSFFPHSSAFFKREVVEQLGGYRTQFLRSQDLDLWLRMSEHGEIMSIDEPLVSIRKHSNQISTENSGNLQVVFSHMAMTSFWSRKLNLVDPARDGSKEMQAFRDFVERCLIENNVFKTKEVISLAKMQLSSSSSHLQKVCVLVGLFLKHPLLMFRNFKNRVFGSSLPKNIALRWTSERAK